jgi:hypothetical protein
MLTVAACEHVCISLKFIYTTVTTLFVWCVADIDVQSSAVMRAFHVGEYVLWSARATHQHYADQ